MQENWENCRNSFWLSANREKIRENDFKKSSEIFSTKCRKFLGGPRIETKFVKWSVSRKRLRTAGLGLNGIVMYCVRPRKPRQRDYSLFTKSRPCNEICSNELTDSTKTELDKYKGAIYIHV